MIAHRKPSLSALLAAMFTVCVGIALFGKFIESDFKAHFKEKHFLSHERDDHNHIGYWLSKLSTMPSEKRIVALGGSGLREALSTKIAADIWKDLGVSFYSFASFDQTLFESYMIFSDLLSKQALNPGSTLLLSVNPRRFTHGIDDAQKLYKAPRIVISNWQSGFTLIQEKAMPNFWHPRVLDYRHVISKYLSDRIDRRFQQSVKQILSLSCDKNCLNSFSKIPFRTPIRYIPYAYPNKALPSEHKKLIATEIQKTRIHEFREHHQFSEKILVEMIKLANNNQINLVLLELPRDPLSYQAYQSIDETYRASLARAENHGATRLSLQNLGLDSHDFYDLDHIRLSSRNKLSSALLKSLTRLTKPTGAYHA